jgi:hypothetical protein
MEPPGPTTMFSEARVVILSYAKYGHLSEVAEK